MYENLYPEAIENIEIYCLYDEKDNKYILGNAESDRYVIVDKEIGIYLKKLLDELDGSHNVCELVQLWNMEYDEVLKTVNFFLKKGLLKKSKENSFSEINRLSKKIVSINCAKLNLILQKTHNQILLLFVPLFFISIVYNIYIACTTNNSNFNIFLFNNSYLKALVLSFLITIPSFLFHEICHAVIAVKYGLKPKSIDICLYLLVFPLFYVKIPGIYTVNRGKRIIILSAGLLGNVFIASIALSFFTFSGHTVWLTVVLAQINTIIANINPFSLSDGYFIMSQLFKKENLRSAMFWMISNRKKRRDKDNMYVLLYTIINLGYIGTISWYMAQYIVSIIGEVLHIVTTNINVILMSVAIFCIYLLIIKKRFRVLKEI